MSNATRILMQAVQMFLLGMAAMLARPAFASEAAVQAAASPAVAMCVLGGAELLAAAGAEADDVGVIWAALAALPEERADLAQCLASPDAADEAARARRDAAVAAMREAVALAVEQRRGTTTAERLRRAWTNEVEGLPVEFRVLELGGGQAELLSIAAATARNPSAIHSHEARVLLEWASNHSEAIAARQRVGQATRAVRAAIDDLLVHDLIAQAQQPD